MLFTMFQKIVEEICASGLTEQQIAEKTGVSQPTINRLRRGQTSDPKSSVADALRDLHRERLTPTIPALTGRRNRSAEEVMP